MEKQPKYIIEIPSPIEAEEQRRGNMRRRLMYVTAAAAGTSASSALAYTVNDGYNHHPQQSLDSVLTGIDTLGLLVAVASFLLSRRYKFRSSSQSMSNLSVRSENGKTIIDGANFKVVK